MSVDTALTQPVATRAPAEASQRSRVLRRLRSGLKISMS